MNGISQRTLASEIELDGVGVHSGEAATLRFAPAEVDSGIRFRRADLDGQPEVPADLDHVIGTELGTSLAAGEARVMTVEHVMASLAAHSVDNALITLSGPEAPIRDGSFLDYFHAIRDAGLVEQDGQAKVITVKEPVTASVSGGASYVATPHEGFRVSATIDFPHPAIGRQFGAFDLDCARFEQEIASARTFGFHAEAEALRERGLARGASLENTVVLDESGVMNEGLRMPDEFLRHKVGDIVGDLALLGARINGHVVADRSSHDGNVALARVLAEHQRKTNGAVVDVRRIMEFLPHRYPMLLVDKVVDFEPGKRIVGIKNVTINEPFFQGHYPDHPIMPGVLIIEAMAQVGGLLLMEGIADLENSVVYFMSLDNVKWRRPVIPGDQLVFEVEMLQIRRHVARMRGKGYVDGQLVAEADLMARIVDK